MPSHGCTSLLPELVHSGDTGMCASVLWPAGGCRATGAVMGTWQQTCACKDTATVGSCTVQLPRPWAILPGLAGDTHPHVSRATPGSS